MGVTAVQTWGRNKTDGQLVLHFYMFYCIIFLSTWYIDSHYDFLFNSCVCIFWLFWELLAQKDFRQCRHGGTSKVSVRWKCQCGKGMYHTSSKIFIIIASMKLGVIFILRYDAFWSNVMLIF